MSFISKIRTLSGDLFDIKDAGAREELNSKADKEDTVLTTTLSRDRAGTAGAGSLSFGRQNDASGDFSSAVGSGNTAAGIYSNAKGLGNIAENRSQMVSGEYNVADPSTASANFKGTYIEIVGNGTGTGNARSNARALDWNGNERIKGDLYVGCNPDSSGGSKVAKDSEVVKDVKLSPNNQSFLGQNGIVSIPTCDYDRYGLIKIGDGFSLNVTDPLNPIAVIRFSTPNDIEDMITNYPVTYI